MYHKTVLKNGTRVITEKLEHSRALSLGIWINTGSRNEEEKDNGITHFIEHMIFKGTRIRNALQIAKELDAIGGFSNAFTGKEYTCFHSKVLDKHFSILADILTDIFLHSVFNQRDVDMEKQVILQEIGLLDDSPDEYIHELFNRQVWTDHPLGRSTLGTGESVSAVNKETIINHMKRFYTPDKIVIAVAGNVEHQHVVSFFRPFFESLEPGGKPDILEKPNHHSGVSTLEKDLEQVHICLGGKAPHLSHDLRFAAAILNTVLGGNMSSRLFQEIREKRGLAYSVYSFLSAYMDTGILGVSLGTDPQQANSALCVINKEIRNIQKGEISESDLKAAQEHLIGGILLGSENCDARMMRIAKNEYIFGKYITYDDLVKSLEKVTIDEVVACANETFNTDEVSLVTIGPIKKDDLDLDCLIFN